MIKTYSHGNSLIQNAESGREDIHGNKELFGRKYECKESVEMCMKCKKKVCNGNCKTKKERESK